MPESVSNAIAGFDIRSRAVPTDLTSLHANPLLHRLYAARGIRSSDQLDTSLAGLLPWQSLKGIDQAIDLLINARTEHQRVLIIGDYDTDGATATALAVLGLRSMGLSVDFLLPNRFEYGYGLSPEIVDLALTKAPDLIITVDNGIASFDGVARAKAAGVRVLITDHHLPAEGLPQADAIINPNQPGCAFASKAACGCTVFYYLLIALRARLRAEQVADLPNLGQWLDLVAVATVADVVPLDANNRRLVQQGLQRIRKGQCRLGIKALFSVAGRSWQTARAADFGFVVGPRLNAAGRLDDMTIGVALLLADNELEATTLAQQLQDLNMERRQIEASMLHDVEVKMGRLVLDSTQHGCVIYGDDWHEGVIGILASRVKDRIHRPVIALAPGDNGLLKGSARSVVGVHLRDSLDWISKQQPQLLEKFGGHAMAAGLTLKAENLDALRHWFDLAIAHFSEPDALTAHLWTDGGLPAEWLTLENALMLESAGPWGQAFPEPYFVGTWTLVAQKILAEKHLKMTLLCGQQQIQAIAFNVDLDQWPTQRSQVRGVYQLSCNRFRGEESLQLMFNRLEPV